MARGKQLAAVTWDGLDSFLDELRVLTGNLVDEANAIMVHSSEAARRDIASHYPVRKGGLRRGLVITPARGTLLSGATLRQTAPHGWIYEHGTKRRQTQAGADRGQMDPTPVFEPIAAAYHRAAIDEVKGRLLQHGASQVTDTADEGE